MAVNKAGVSLATRMPSFPVPQQESLRHVLLGTILADSMQNTPVERGVPLITGALALEQTAFVPWTLEHITNAVQLRH